MKSCPLDGKPNLSYIVICLIEGKEVFMFLTFIIIALVFWHAYSSAELEDAERKASRYRDT